MKASTLLLLEHYGYIMIILLHLVMIFVCYYSGYIIMYSTVIILCLFKSELLIY